MKPCQKWDQLIEQTALELTGATRDYQPEWDAVRYFIGELMFAMRGENKNGDSLLTLKLPIGDGEILRSHYPDIIPGYHMNKQHWNSLLLAGDVPEPVLIEYFTPMILPVFNWIPAVHTLILATIHKSILAI
ncbi:MmcQ/YjbR family DNA-binding protein [Acetobacterium paludosum]|uniref:MmcQ/YjbR family DNA-binding protein n=1 Tax=Acetobacterium paludosum TaxID=52693 RepID=A0A923I1N2_9FIRM|nr:MmcQ/YjbR family DNA-binding protein [Acetobacterium paludosum]MBC3887445.1 MmcQ/YjbR family DNA-binding protein [Acetobacterium paludosum]